MKVRDLLTDETRWTKGVSARNALGQGGVCYDDPSATSWCLAGAIHKCYGIDGWDPIAKRVYALIQPLPKGGMGEWNDDPARSFSEVRALVEELDI